MADPAASSAASCLEIDAVLADPAVSFAVKGMVRLWMSRDCVDAAQDARPLCVLFEYRADRALGRSL